MKYFIETENAIQSRSIMFSIQRIDENKYGERMFQFAFGGEYTKTEVMELLTEAMSWVLKEEDDE